VVLLSPFLGLIQFLYSFIDVFHGGDAVSSPFSASMLEIIPGALQSATGGVDLSRNISPLRSAGEKVDSWRDDQHQEHSQSCESHGESPQKWNAEQCAG
jgi:hypothetical protein